MKTLRVATKQAADALAKAKMQGYEFVVNQNDCIEIHGVAMGPDSPLRRETIAKEIEEYDKFAHGLYVA